MVSIRKAVASQYDSLYNTAKDVLEKQKEMIEEKVDKEAVELTSKSITRADKILKLRQENEEEIRRRAMAYVERYKNEMTPDLYEETKRQVEKAKIVDKPVKKAEQPSSTNEKKKKTTVKRRPTTEQSNIEGETPKVRRKRPTVAE